MTSAQTNRVVGYVMAISTFIFAIAMFRFTWMWYGRDLKISVSTACLGVLFSLAAIFQLKVWKKIGTSSIDIHK